MEICMQNIDYTLVYINTISAISRTFTFGPFKTISEILLMNSNEVISFGRPGLSMISVLGRAQRNSVNHF